MTIEDERLYFSLDTQHPIPISPGEFLLDGWFLPLPGLNQSEWTLLAIVDGIAHPAIRSCPRPDVGRAHNIAGAAECGFVFLLERPKWESKVRVVARYEDQEIALSELSVATRAELAKTKPLHLAKSYRDWLSHHEPSLFWSEAEIPEKLQGLRVFPQFSIILPTFNTDRFFLERCLRSVQKQHYPHWQLCITDDGSHDADLIAYLQGLAGSDQRILFQRNEKSGGISRASNRSLELATGDYVVLLDHDDELHPHALLEVARYLNKNADTALIYSDEDKMDSYCRRSSPAFKPDFDLDMFRAFNYIGHLVAVRRSLVQQVGGFRSAADGAQDWDLLMRIIEIIGPAAVGHIAKPLYHWRMHEHSTAQDLLSKPYVRKAWVHTLHGHLERMSEAAAVEPGIAFGTMRVLYNLPSPVRIAVFVRLEDGPYQRAVLRTVPAPQTRGVYQVADCIVRRNADDDTGEDLISSLSDIPEDVFVFINGPLETVNHLFFEELASQAMRHKCGVVTGISLAADGTISHSGYLGCGRDELRDPFIGLDLAEPSYMSQTVVTRRVESISDRFFATRRANIVALGGIASISSTKMPQLAAKLVQHAAAHELETIVTPFAVATFDESPAESQTLIREAARRPFTLNPNFSAFDKLESVARGSI